jgi:hypothetical protein
MPMTSTETMTLREGSEEVVGEWISRGSGGLLLIESGQYHHPLCFGRGQWDVRGVETSSESRVSASWSSVCIQVDTEAEVSISDLRLTSDREYALGEEATIRVMGGRLTLTQMDISSATGHGLWGRGVYQIQCQEVRWHDCGRCGVWVHGDSQGGASSTFECESTIFEANGSMDITLEGGEEETDGVWCEGSGEGRFLRCIFRGNHGDGLYIKGGQYTVKESTFERNLVNGLYYGERAKGEVYSCIFTQNKTAHLGLKGAEVSVKETQFIEGEGVGVFCLSSGDLHLQSVEILDQRGVGVLIDGSADEGEGEGEGSDPQEITLIDSSDSTERLRLDVPNHNEEETLERSEESAPQITSCTLKAEGCRISNGGAPGILITKDVQAILTRCSFSENQEAQIAVNQSSFLTLSHCQISGGEVGLLLAEGGRGAFDTLSISGGKTAQVMIEGREVDEAQSEPVMNESTFHNLRCINGEGVGIYLTQGATASFEDTTISAPESNCIQLEEGSRARFNGLTTYGGFCAIWALLSAKITAENLNLIKPSEAGIKLSSKAMLTLDNSQIKESGGAGLWVHAGMAILSHVKITLSQKSNVLIHGRGEVHLIDNELTDSQDAGLLIQDEGSHVDLIGGRVSHNLSAGLWATQRAKIKAENVIISDQLSGGVFFRGGSTGQLIDCELRGNRKAGVEIEGGGTPSLLRCLITQGQDAGLLIREGSGAEVEECEITENRLSGIVISKGAHPSICRTQIARGLDLGVWMMSGALGEIKDCWIYGHAQGEWVAEEGAETRLEENQIQTLEDLEEMLKH